MMFSVFLCAGIQCSSGDSCWEGTHSDSSETVGGKSQSQLPEQGDYYYYMHAVYTQVHNAHCFCLEVTYTLSSITCNHSLHTGRPGVPWLGHAVMHAIV